LSGATGNCLRNLAAKPLSELEMQVCHRTYRPGKTLFAPDEPARDLLIIRTGWVKIYFLNAAGKEQIVELFGPGGLVGETVVSGNNSGAQYAAALSIVSTHICQSTNWKFFFRLTGFHTTTNLPRMITAAYDITSLPLRRLLS